MSLLHEQTLNSISGEAKSKELCLYLMQAASMPYMQILEKWVYKGVICDPYQEVSIINIFLCHAMYCKLKIHNITYFSVFCRG